MALFYACVRCWRYLTGLIDRFIFPPLPCFPFFARWPIKDPSIHPDIHQESNIADREEGENSGLTSGMQCKPHAHQLQWLLEPRVWIDFKSLIFCTVLMFEPGLVHNHHHHHHHHRFTTRRRIPFASHPTIIIPSISSSPWMAAACQQRCKESNSISAIRPHMCLPDSILTLYDLLPFLHACMTSSLETYIVTRLIVCVPDLLLLLLVL